MILVDTSVWIEIFKDKTGHTQKAFRDRMTSISMTEG
jgi:predicted nucleic acid-binding protein